MVIVMGLIEKVLLGQIMGLNGPVLILITWGLEHPKVEPSPVCAPSLYTPNFLLFFSAQPEETLISLCLNLHIIRGRSVASW